MSSFISIIFVVKINTNGSGILYIKFSLNMFHQIDDEEAYNSGLLSCVVV